MTFLQNHDQVGNRAFGERLDHLADPKKLALARAGLLLAPQIPMLWMGEEWSASTPFLFFVDFAPDEDLNKAVRDGRRREFKSFAAFADDTSKHPGPHRAGDLRGLEARLGRARGARRTGRCWPRRRGSWACAATWSCP